MKFLKKAFTLSIFFLIVMEPLSAGTVGSWTDVSYDTNIFFPQGETNLIQGFSFTSGFSLESNATTCTFNSCMPVTGDIYLNGGTLYLLQDFILRNTSNLVNAGSISGGGHIVELAENIDVLRFSPTLGGKIVLVQSAISDEVYVPVNSVDWRYDGNYFVSGSNGGGGIKHIKVFTFDGDNIVEVAREQVEASEDVISVGWHPYENLIAIGGKKKGSPGTVGVYTFDEVTKNLDSYWKDEEEFKSGATAVSWHPTGNWLAVGGIYNSTKLDVVSIYEKEGATEFASYTFPANQDVSWDAMDWDISGSYLAVGLDTVGTNSTLAILHFDGSTLTFTRGTYTGYTVRALDWHPTDSLIVVGLQDSSIERLRLYHFNPDTWMLDELTTATIGETSQDILSVHWCSAGRKIVVGLEAGSGSEVRVYSFDSTNTTFSLDTETEFGLNVNAVRWSPSCCYVAIGNGETSNYFLSVWGFPCEESVLSIRDITHFYLNSDVSLQSPILFENDCVINTRDNKFIIQDRGNIVIGPDSTVHLEHGRVRFDKPGSITFLSPTSRLHLQNTTLELASDAFVGNGSVEIDNDVEVRGPYNFWFATRETSTVDSFSSLRVVDDATLKLGRISGGLEPIYFTDHTSSLIFDNGSFIITPSGATLTKGTIDVQGRCTFSIDSTNYQEALVLGDGTADNNVTMTIRGGSELDLLQGSLIIDPSHPDSLLFLGNEAQLSLESTSTFYLRNSLNFVNGVLYLATGATVTKDSGVYLTTNKTRLYDHYQDFYLTGTLSSVDSVVLDQNDELILRHGNLSKTITVSRNDNAIYGDGLLSGNIIFNDENSTLTWNIDAKVDEYSMILNDGVLSLERDLDFYQDLQGFAVVGDVTLSGTLNLDNHVMHVSANDSAWTGSFYCSGNGSCMVFSAKVSLSGTWTIDGVHTIDGNGQTMELLSTAQLFVAPDSTLTIRNMVLKNLSGTKLSCLASSAQVVFDNVLLVQDGDYKFDAGSIIFRNKVDLLGGSGCSDEATYSFSYNSDQSSMIDGNSTFYIMRGVRFELGNQSAGASDQPLEFVDWTSVLHLDESILRIVDQGLKLKSGRMRVSNSSILDVDTTYGVTLGDGSVATNDFFVEIEGDARLSIDSGVLYYNNVAKEDRIIFIDTPATLRINTIDGLTAQKDMLLKNGTLSFPEVDYLETLGSAVIDQYHVRHIHDSPYSSHMVQGRFQTGFGYLLIDDGFVSMQSGRATVPFVFDPGTSTLCGVGIIESSLTLRDKDTTVLMGLESELNSDIALNGGTLNLSTHLVFVGDKTITGSGKIVLNKNKFYFGSDELTLTHTIFWDMSSAVYLGGKTSLSGTWTFSGVGSLNGDGNIIDISSGGRIVVDPDSTLYLSDIVIKGLGDNHGTFIFMNDGSQIYLSNVSIVLSSDYTMTIGGVYVEGPTTWYMDNYSWAFDQLASLTVDGMTLWKDSLDKFIPGDILFGAPESCYLTLLNSGTIKEVANGEWIMSETTLLGNREDVIHPDIDNIYLFLSTIDHGPFNLYFDSDTTMSYNIYLGPHHNMQLAADMTLNGSTWYIHFSRANEPLLLIDPGKTVTLRDIVLKDFHPSYVSFGDATSELVFGGGTTIEFIDDFTLTRRWTFTGNCKLKGFDTKITLGSGGVIDVYDGSSLTLEDLTISGLSSTLNNLRCRTNDGSIVLKDSELALSNDYVFDTGSLSFEHDVKLTGTRTFVYSSSMTSTIASESRLYVDHGVTLRYDPPIANGHLLYMTNTTSKLHLNGCVLCSTPTGLILKRGMVFFDNYVTLSAEGLLQSEAIVFGDPVDVSGTDDLIIVPLGGSYVETYGYIDTK